MSIKAEGNTITASKIEKALTEVESLLQTI